MAPISTPDPFSDTVTLFLSVSIENVACVDIIVLPSRGCWYLGSLRGPNTGSEYRKIWTLLAPEINKYKQTKSQYNVM